MKKSATGSTPAATKTKAPETPLDEGANTKPRGEGNPATSPVTASSQVPATTDAIDMDEMAKDARVGMENVTGADLALPFLVILQANSPQAKKSDPNYIQGAEEGDFYNTLTGELIKGNQGVALIPCFYEKALLEWRPRHSGGGLVKIYRVDDPIQHETKRNEKNKDVLPNGNILVGTAQHYCLYCPLKDGKPDGDWEPVVVAMSSTQLKKSRRWNAMIGGIQLRRADGSAFTPPAFSHWYVSTTAPESNQHGAWMSWTFETGGRVESKSVYTSAKHFHSIVSEGKVKVRHSDLNKMQSRERQPGEDLDDNMPF